MNQLPKKSKSTGFSLIEVVMAIALVAIAIPTILGMFTYLSKASLENKDFGDAESVTNAVLLHLENDKNSTFPVVYNWVKLARQDPTQAKILYTFKGHDERSMYLISEEPPKESDISLLDGRIMAVEIQAPKPNILPIIPPQLSSYKKSYLPLQLDIYALNSADETRSRANFLESYPAILSR